MQYLQEYGDLPLKYVKRREVLSGQLAALLHRAGGDGDLNEVTEANLLREKLLFVLEVVDQWIAGGGLGCSPEGAQRARWSGPQQKEGGGRKEEWITVGRFGGDAVRS
jgi:myosin-1